MSRSLPTPNSSRAINPYGRCRRGNGWHLDSIRACKGRPNGDRCWTAARLPAASRPGHQPIPHRFATIRLRYDRPSRGRHLPRSLRNYTLVTLKDAANLNPEASKVEQDLEDWQAAVETLLLVVDLNGPPMMMGGTGMLRALNRQVERVLNPSRKDPHWGKRKL